MDGPIQAMFGMSAAGNAASIADRTPADRLMIAQRAPDPAASRSKSQQDNSLVAAYRSMAPRSRDF